MKGGEAGSLLCELKKSSEVQYRKFNFIDMRRPGLQVLSRVIRACNHCLQRRKELFKEANAAKSYLQS